MSASTVVNTLMIQDMLAGHASADVLTGRGKRALTERPRPELQRTRLGRPTRFGGVGRMDSAFGRAVTAQPRGPEP